MQTPIKSILPWVLAGYVLLTGCQTTGVNVMGKGWTSDNYVRTNLPAGVAPQPESYGILKGTYFSGTTRDRSIDQMSIQEIAEILQPELEKQGYFFNPDPTTADLLIVVHWGVTQIDTEIVEQEFAVSGSDDPFQTEVELYERQTWKSRFDNAQLLGAQDVLQFAQSIGEYDREERLEEEQYFFILVGYDLAALRAQEEKPIRFVTQFSAPQLTGSFDEVLPALARVGSTYVGVRTESSLSRTHIGEGDVEMGELEEVDKN